jgi:cytochrome c
MKKLIFLAIILFASISCKKEAQEDFGKTQETQETQNTSESDPNALGKSLFEGKGMCASCHLADKKVIGPSIQEIVQIYDDKKASIVTFLQGKGEPIVDPSQYEIMKANFSVTKTMTEDELKAIETYMYSFKK